MLSILFSAFLLWEGPIYVLNHEGEVVDYATTAYLDDDRGMWVVEVENLKGDVLVTTYPCDGYRLKVREVE